jgi:hypothetical protein
MSIRPIASAFVVVACLCAAAPARAQGAAGVRRTADGKPDLSGLWQTIGSANWNIQDHSAEKGIPAGQGIVEGNDVPYRPEALAKKQANFANRATEDPEAKCNMVGLPRSMYMPYPFQIFQTPGMITMLFEYVHTVRYIYTNGSKHPDGHIDWWMGDSRARWEGDTLVVDVIDFNEDTWFDRAGNYHSDALHVVERFTPSDPDHITYEATIEDAKTFTRPWKISTVLYRRKETNVQLLEYECYGFDFEKYYPYPDLAKGSK